MSAEYDVFYRDVNTIEEVQGDNPEEIMNNKYGIVIQLCHVCLKNGD